MNKNIHNDDFLVQQMYNEMLANGELPLAPIDNYQLDVEAIYV